jgi:fructose-1-phosphate kinase PfkB-like protein
LAKPNGSEVSELLGVQVETPADAAEAARALLKQGIEMAVVSLGSDGLVLAHQEGIVFATPPAIQERNAVGAGDALAAGLVWALDQGFCPVDVARWGVATGTASAAVDGVASGTRQEIEAILASVQISTG